MLQPPSIVTIGGWWSTNIGNAFFNLGTQRLLSRAAPEASITILADMAGWAPRWNRLRGNPVNDLQLLRYVRADYVVLEGPCLTRALRPLWESTFRALRNRGTRIIYMSAGLLEYSPEETRTVRSVLRDYPPYLLVSRDRETFERVGDLAVHAYDGIDAAFFVNEVYQPVALEMGDFVVLGFEQAPEPVLRNVGKHEKGTALGERKLIEIGEETFEILPWGGGLSGTVQRPLLRRILRRLGIEQRRRYPARIGQYSVCRTKHAFNAYRLKSSYVGPNTFLLDVPFGHLSLYAQARAVLSDRVHACVASLAYGTPAMFFGKTPRSRLLDRIGATDISRRLTTVSRSTLEAEKNRMVQFVSRALR